MAKNNLNETIIKKIKNKPKQFKISDGEGLYLLVHPNGSKYWRFDFRFDGKQKSSSLGVWPEVSLDQARIIRNSAKIKIREGINPIEEKRNKKIFSKNNNDLEENVKTSKIKKSFDPLQNPEINSSFLSSRKNNNHHDLKEFFLDLFSEFSEKGFSELSKEDVTKMLKNILENRKKLFSILWIAYPTYPFLQLIILFTLLFFTTDIISAFFTTFFYFLFSVIFSIGYDYWRSK